MTISIAKEEASLLKLERSYRNERLGAGILAAFTGLPLILFSILQLQIGYMSARDIPSDVKHRIEIPINSRQQTANYSSTVLFMIFFFFAYRAHSRLTLIKHIKYHQTQIAPKETI